jgi:hypothetical protein
LVVHIKLLHFDKNFTFKINIMNRKIYTLTLFAALVAGAFTAQAQLGGLKNKLKDKVSKTSDGSSSGNNNSSSGNSNTSSGNSSTPANNDNSSGNAPANNSTPPPAKPAEPAKAQSGPQKENKRLPGDVRIVNPEGEDDAEHDLIAASKAATEIIGFRFYLKTCEEQAATNEIDERSGYGGNLNKMQEQWAKIPKKDPAFDMSKFAATYRKYDSIEHVVHAGDYAAIETTKKGNAKITAEQVDEQLGKDFGSAAWFSTLMCSGNRTSVFTNYKPEEVSQGKRVVLETENNGSRTFYYPHVLKTEIGYHLQDIKRRIREYSHPHVYFEHDNYHKKDNLTYCIYTSDREPIKGFMEEPDGTIVVIHVPSVSQEDFSKAGGASAVLGYNRAYDLYDYDKTEVDVWAKDEATAKGANLEAKKKEAIAALKKNIKEDDARKEEAHNKDFAATKPDPEGMKVPELQAGMMQFGQQFWDENVVGQNREELGLKGGKLSKIWSTSQDWDITKNDLGVILYRSMYAEAIVHLPSGKCYLYMYHFKQDYSGGGEYTKLFKADWVEAAAESSRRLKQMPCGNAR